MLNNNHAGMSSSLEWACKVLNSVCITMDKILNISCCWLIHQPCWASQLGASQGLQSTWEGYKSCGVWSTPGACPGAASLWNSRTSGVGAADAPGSAGGIWGRAMWQLWQGTCVHRVCVWYPRGDLCCCSIPGCAFVDLVSGGHSCW